MVVRLAIILTLARVEQEVAGDEFKRHASHRPQVCTHIIVQAKHHFWTTVLARLDLLSEVVVGPAAVAKITDLQRDFLIC